MNITDSLSIEAAPGVVVCMSGAVAGSVGGANAAAVGLPSAPPMAPAAAAGTAPPAPPASLPGGMHLTPIGTAAPPPLAVPSLRGNLEILSTGHHICKGLWALSDAMHEVEGQTSEFELKLSKIGPDQSPDAYPCNGKYTGWFKLKSAKSGKSKFDDSVDLRFTRKAATDAEAGTDGIKYDVQGDGRNQFGSFKLHGWLDAHTQVLQMYRVYQAKTPRAKTPKAPHRAPVVGASSEPKVPARQRKVNPAFSEYVDGSQMGSNGGVRKPKPEGEVRPQRLNPALIKCSNILGDLMKQPAAAFFAAPVDWEKLNISDYPLIVKIPMDLGTVRAKLTSFEYETHVAFAGDMRLVFRNAIEYNQSRDHPVHKAARDLAGKFEQRFLALANSLPAPLGPGGAKLPSGHAATGIPGLVVPKPAPRRKSTGGAKAIQRQRSLGMAPVAAPNNDLVEKMAQKMDWMEQEIARLTQNDHRQQATTVLQQHQKAAENPLSVDEKRALVAKVHKLPPARMGQVVEIIRESMQGSGNSGEDMEIPIDDLDTFTLRRLQEFVASGGGVTKAGATSAMSGGGGSNKKRKSIGGAAAGRKSTSGGGAKKARPAAAMPAAPSSHFGDPVVGVGAPMAAMGTPAQSTVPEFRASDFGSHFGAGGASAPVPVQTSPAPVMQALDTGAPDLGSPLPPYESAHRRRSASLEADDLLANVDSIFGDDDDDDDVNSSSNIATTAADVGGWSTAPTAPAYGGGGGGGGSLWSQASDAKNAQSSAETARVAVETAARAQAERVKAERAVAMAALAQRQSAEREAEAASDAAVRTSAAQALETQRERERVQRQADGGAPLIGGSTEERDMF